MPTTDYRYRYQYQLGTENRKCKSNCKKILITALLSRCRKELHHFDRAGLNFCIFYKIFIRKIFGMEGTEASAA
jgi:hypothetical protein